jgi:hypothetical protein
MRGSRIAQKDPKQAIGDHRSGAILTSPPALNLNSTVKFLADLVLPKKPSDKTAATKSGEIFPGEFFFDLTKMPVVFLGLLSYILFHLLSASFVVAMVGLIPYLYYRWRHFFRKF